MESKPIMDKKPDNQAPKERTSGQRWQDALASDLGSVIPFKLVINAIVHFVESVSNLPKNKPTKELERIENFLEIYYRARKQMIRNGATPEEIKRLDQKFIIPTICAASEAIKIKHAVDSSSTQAPPIELS